MQFLLADKQSRSTHCFSTHYQGWYVSWKHGKVMEFDIYKFKPGKHGKCLFFYIAMENAILEGGNKDSK